MLEIFASFCKGSVYKITEGFVFCVLLDLPTVPAAKHSVVYSGSNSVSMSVPVPVNCGCPAVPSSPSALHPSSLAKHLSWLV